jgi:FtsZ-binding cell division protein ZapB
VAVLQIEVDTRLKPRQQELQSQLDSLREELQSQSQQIDPAQLSRANERISVLEGTLQGTGNKHFHLDGNALYMMRHVFFFLLRA